PRVLVAPRTPSVTGTVRDVGRRRDLGRDRRPLAVVRTPRPGRRRGGVRQQLVADLATPPLLRALRAALAAQPSVVTRDRGAVLHLLAVDSAARRARRTRA